MEKEKATLKERGKEVRELLKVVTVSSICFCWHEKFIKQFMLRCTFIYHSLHKHVSKSPFQQGQTFIQDQNVQ